MCIRDRLKGHANVNYVVQGPYAEVERTEGVNSRAAGAMSSDSQMAYHCALMWVITGEQRYADKAIEILNAWSGTLTALIGGDDMLMSCLLYTSQIASQSLLIIGINAMLLSTGLIMLSCNYAECREKL